MLACSRENLPSNQECKRCLLISEKWTEREGKLTGIDTLWNDIACGRALDSVRSKQPQWQCNLSGGWEYIYYKIS